MAANRSVTVKILADLNNYVRGINKGVEETNRLGRAVKKANSGVGFDKLGKSAMKAAGGATVLYAAYSQGKSAIDTTEKLAKGTLQLQRVTKLSVKDASEFVAVTQARGIETTKLSVSFTALSKQIVAAQQGGKKAAEAFAQLGVSQQAIKAGDTKQVLFQAADGLGKMGVGANRTALAAQLFGKSYRDLFPLLLKGGQGIKDNMSAAGAFGAVLDGKTLPTMEAWRKAQITNKLAMMGIQIFIATTLIPWLTKAIGAVSAFVLQFRQGKGAGGEFKKTLLEIWSVLGPIASALIHHAGLVLEIAVAWKAARAAIAVSNMYGAIMSSLGSESAVAAAGASRGAAFGAAFKGSAMIGIAAFAPLFLSEVDGAVKSVKTHTSQLKTSILGPYIGGWLDQLINDSSGQGQNAGKKITTHLAAGVRQGSPAVYASLSDLISGVSKRGVAQAKASGTIGSTIASAITAGVRGNTSITAAVMSTLAAAKRKAATASNWFGPIGANIAGGVAAGISRGVDSVVAAAINMVDAANKAAKKRSQQNSPSLLFAKIGAGLVEGMALGMSNTAPIAAAAGAMIAAATPKLGIGNSGVRGILGGQINNAGGFGGTQGVNSSFGQDTVNQMLLQALTYASTHVSKQKVPKGASQGTRDRIDNRNAAAQTRADNALAALQARIAALAARAAAIETLRSYVQTIKDAIKAARLAELMAPVNAAREDRAQRADDAGRASLGSRITQAQSDANNPVVQARYQQQAARLQQRIQQAQHAGNLDLVDSLTAEKEALDARYGPAYLTGLQDQLAQLNENAVERTADTTAQKFADSFGAGLDAAFTAFTAGGSIPAFVAALTAAMANSGVSLPSVPNAGVPEALGTVAGTTPAGTPTSTGGQPVASLADWVNAWLGQHPKYTNKAGKQAAASVIGKAFGVSKAAVWTAGGTGHFGGRVANKASGGYLTPGALTMVGETGPELVVGGKVSSATRTSRMGAGAGMNITVNAVGAAANDPVLLARQLGWQLATR